MKFKILFFSFMAMQLVASEAERPSEQQLTSRTPESLKKYLENSGFLGARDENNLVGGLKPISQTKTDEDYMHSVNGSVYCGFSKKDSYWQMVLSYSAMVTLMQIAKRPNQNAMNMSPVVEEYRRRWSHEYPLNVSDSDLKTDQDRADTEFVKHAMDDVDARIALHFAMHPMSLARRNKKQDS